MERSRVSRERAVPLALASALALVFVFGTSLAPRARDFFVNVAAPKASDTYASLSRDALSKRLEDAEAELSKVKYQATLYGLLAEENSKLRIVAHAAASSQGIVGRVVARPPRTLYDTLLLDRGRASGVGENDTVIYEGVALGKIISVGETSSTVELFSSPGVLHDAILGEPKAVAVAHGLGGGAFEVSVPRGVGVFSGDPVRAPGSESLVLGIVVAVTVEKTDVSEMVHFASPISLADIDFVQIIK